MKIIERSLYLKQLVNVIGTPDIKIVTGIRRSGKSKLLQSLSAYIFATDEAANIVSVNLQELDNENLLEYHALHDYAINNHYEGKNNYLFIDEIQMCEGFEKAINSLHSKNIYDIYVTGSNAFLLSSDLATLFTGRTFQIEIYPFSFAEFQDYHRYQYINEAFEDYTKMGGFAGSYVYRTIEEKYNYINRDIYETIVTRDLVQKYKIRNKEVLYNLTSYMLDNISNLTSSRNVTSYLTNNNEAVTNKTIDNYIKYLCNAFVLYKVGRYDLKGKKYLVTENKYYLADHSIRYANLGTKNLDIGRIYENMVYIELLRRGYEVYIGKLYKKEVDFVALKRNEQIYIQVSSYLQDENVMNREISPLLAVKDAYPKIIIARTHQEEYSVAGVKVIDIAVWLINN